MSEETVQLLVKVVTYIFYIYSPFIVIFTLYNISLAYRKRRYRIKHKEYFKKLEERHGE